MPNPGKKAVRAKTSKSRGNIPIYRRSKAQVIQQSRNRQLYSKAVYNPVKKESSPSGFELSPPKEDQLSIGAKIGSSIGAGLGGAAEHAIRWLVGHGDYQVKKNSLLTLDPPPMINRSARGGVMIRHREYLGDIFTSSTPGAFQINSFPLNPGMDVTFPFLSQIAGNFEQYSFSGAIFEFRSMSADALNSTNTALGTVIMSTQYDSLDVTFATKSEMENYEFGSSCKPSENMMHPIECARSQTTLTEMYTRSGAQPSGADIRFYDWGKFSIATQGFQGNQVNIGELWVTYQVNLFKPKLYVSLGSANAIFKYRATGCVVAGSNALGTTITEAIGTVPIPPVPYGPITNNGIVFAPVSVQTTYLVLVSWTGTVAAAVAPCTITLQGGVTYGTYWGSTDFIPPSGTSSLVSEQSFCLIINPTFNISNLPSALFSGGVLPAGSCVCRVTITQIDNVYQNTP